MDGRRLRFLAAVVVFLLWVAALGTLALRSGRKPPKRVGAVSPSHRRSLSPLDDARSTFCLVVDASPSR